MQHWPDDPQEQDPSEGMGAAAYAVFCCVFVVALVIRYLGGAIR